MAKTQMDPTACWKRYLNHLIRYEPDKAAQALIDLRDGLVMGGAPPAGFTYAEICVLIGALLERHRITERIREAKAHQRHIGRYLGGKVPFGWRRDNGGLVENPAEQDAIALMLASYEQGLSSPKIADRLWRTHKIRLSRPTIWRIINRAKKEPS